MNNHGKLSQAQGITGLDVAIFSIGHPKPTPGKGRGDQDYGKKHRNHVSLAPALSYEEVEETMGHLVGPQGELWDREKIFYWARMPKIFF